MFTLPYQIIKNKLKARIPVIKDLDWFMNQYSTTDKSTMLLDLPGVYVQFLPADTEQMGKHTQAALVQFDIHLVTSNLHPKGEKRIEKLNANDHAVIMDGIYKYLNGKKGKMGEADNPGAANYLVFNSLKRIRVTPPHELKANMVSIQRFEGLMFDYAANKVYQKLTPDLDVNPE